MDIVGIGIGLVFQQLLNDFNLTTGLHKRRQSILYKGGGYFGNENKHLGLNIDVCTMLQQHL